MKRLATVLATVALVVTLGGAASTATAATLPASPAPVTAASPAPVTIAKLPTKTVKKGKTVTVKPSVKTAGSDVKVTSKRITATKKGVNLKNKTSVKLKAGTYKVTQTVTYKVKQTQSATFKKYETSIPECEILRVNSGDWEQAQLRVACKAYDLPGTQKFTVDVEWKICSWSAYLDNECTASQYIDSDAWWEGRTTDGVWRFGTFDDEGITPEAGETFDAYLQSQVDSVTLTGKVWSKTKTATRTQTLKVVMKK